MGGLSALTRDSTPFRHRPMSRIPSRPPSLCAQGKATWRQRYLVYDRHWSTGRSQERGPIFFYGAHLPALWQLPSIVHNRTRRLHRKAHPVQSLVPRTPAIWLSKLGVLLVRGSPSIISPSVWGGSLSPESHQQTFWECVLGFRGPDDRCSQWCTQRLVARVPDSR